MIYVYAVIGTSHIIAVVTLHHCHCFQQQQQPFYGPLSGTTRVSWYQKKHSPTHHPDHHPVFISFFHLPQSIASSLFKLRAWQSFCTTSVHVLFGLPLGLEPSTSYSIHFFTQSVSSFSVSLLAVSYKHFYCACYRPNTDAFQKSVDEGKMLELNRNQ